METTNKNLYMNLGVTAAESTSAMAEENWKMLFFLNLYRLAIAGLAVTAALLPEGMPPFGETAPALFTAVSLLYLGLSAGGLATARVRVPDFENQATFFAFADVTVITLLMHASGGEESGLALLLIVAVAAVSLMLDRRMTIFFASLATIAVGLEYNWAALTGGEFSGNMNSQFAMLGIGLFATAGLGHLLASRLRATEALAVRRGVDLANLSQVNELIIHHMQSGVIVCDQVGHVRTMNKTARNFLAANPSLPQHPLLTDLSSDLAAQLFQWRENRDNRVRQLLRTRAGYTLLPRFVLGGTEPDAGILIFLEDTAILRQQAQQLKMAALARLTASIAHEIRNPLGAISNAAQLLSETGTHASEDRRLIQIIEDQSRRMNVIVENVMQLSRRDHVNPVKFELHQWLHDFAQQYCDMSDLPGQAIAVLGQKGIAVYVDPDQLYQVIYNLCQNSFRNSPPFSGKPVVELESGWDADNRPCLDVIDFGAGIPPEIADNIFDPFFTTTPRGTGLGLYIARELCEANGARIDYHPGEGVGSRFRIAFVKADD